MNCHYTHTLSLYITKYGSTVLRTVYRDDTAYPASCPYILHFHVSLFIFPNARRLSDILRRGKRHFRRSLTRARSEDEHPSPHVPLTPKVPLEPPTSTPPKPIPPRSSSFSLSSATDHHPLATPPAPQGSKFSTNEGTSSNSPGIHISM